MSLDTRALQELVKTVGTRRVTGHGSDGDNEGIPIYNTPERLEAAERLAKAGAAQALAALQDFFVENLLKLNLVHDTDQKGFHHFAYPSDMRRVAKALISLSGAETFSGMMMAKVMPALQAKAVEDRRFYSEQHISSEQTKTLSFLRTAFGGIGDWKRQVASRLADEENRRREEENKRREEDTRQRAEREKIRREEQAKRRAEEERRLTVQRDRRLRRECTMCGRPLGLVDRLLRREKHDGCRSFSG